MRRLDPLTPARLEERAVAGFRSAFGEHPTATGHAPGRVNLIGEHTDYNAGLCLPLALPHAACAAARSRADDAVRVASAQQPGVWTSTRVAPGQVRDWPAHVAGVVWALREAGVDVGGVDLFVDSTVPVGAGLSSSAAVQVATALGVLAVTGTRLAPDSVVAACMAAEREVVGAPTGGMDQTVALHGRAGSALLLDFADGSRQAVPVRPADAGLDLLVIDTGVAHSVGDGKYADRRADCEAAAAALGVPSLRAAGPADLARLPDGRLRRRARHVVTENQRVAAVVGALEDGDWTEVGRLLDASHASLRDDFDVSCPELNSTVLAARGAGALGARMTGAGFGGSAVSLVPTERVTAVVAAVDEALAGISRPAYLLARHDP